MTSNQNGRSMIEMLGVLAIVGVLSIGGIMGYSKAMAKYKSNQLLSQMAELSINIRTLFFHQNEFTGLNERVLINAGIIPTSMLTSLSSSGASSGTLITHALSGHIRIFPSQTESNQEKAFEIYADGLSQEACLLLASNDWGEDPASGLMAMYVGTDADGIDAPLMESTYSSSGSDLSTGILTPGKHENALPISPMVALSLCACSGSKTCVIGLKYM